MSNPFEGCFVFDDSTNGGFYGHLNDADDAALCMSEASVARYIRAYRPELFKRLRGLPVRSFEIRLAGPQSSAHIALSRAQQSLHHSRPSLISIDGKAGSFESPPPVDQNQLNLLQVQHKRNIQSCLLNGYRLVLRRVREYNVSITCACASCSQTNASLEFGTFFLTLIETSKFRLSKINNSSTSYSLACIEHLFQTGSILSNSPFTISIAAAPYDGASEMPKRKRDSTNDNLNGNAKRSQLSPQFPFEYPSNSNINHRLRKERDDEINETLKAEEKLERAYNENADDRTRLPDLTLRRPPNHTNFEERYRKQGLTKTVYAERSNQNRLERERTASLEEKNESAKDLLPSPTNTLFDPEVRRICYCLEPEDDDGCNTIKCAGKFCLIGFFHLRCVQIDEDLDDGDFFCEDCLPAANRQREEQEQANHSTIENTMNDESTLIAGAESEIEELDESHDEGSGRPSPASNKGHTEWVENERAIIKGAMDEISNILNDDPNLAVPDSDEDIDEWPYEEEAALATHLPPTFPGFVAINHIIRTAPYLPQLDGNSSPLQQPHHGNPRYISPRRHNPHLPQTPRTQIPLPAGYTSTPFHALAPFITPSLSKNDAHALTVDEGRYVWCWKASCPPTALDKALPKGKTRLLMQETERGSVGLRDWWIDEVERISLEGGDVLKLSDVLGVGEV